MTNPREIYPARKAATLRFQPSPASSANQVPFVFVEILANTFHKFFWRLERLDIVTFVESLPIVFACAVFFADGDGSDDVSAERAIAFELRFAVHLIASR